MTPQTPSARDPHQAHGNHLAQSLAQASVGITPERKHLTLALRALAPACYLQVTNTCRPSLSTAHTEYGGAQPPFVVTVSSICRPQKKFESSWGGICAFSFILRQCQDTLQAKPSWSKAEEAGQTEAPQRAFRPCPGQWTTRGHARIQPSAARLPCTTLLHWAFSRPYQPTQVVPAAGLFRMWPTEHSFITHFSLRGHLNAGTMNQ